MKFSRVYIVFFLLFSSLFSIQIKAQIIIASPSITYTENFDGIGSSATAALPSGWKVSGSGGGTSYGLGNTQTTVAAGTSGTGVLTGTPTGGTYNFANGITGSSTDRAVGFFLTSSYLGTRSLMVKLNNTTGSTITNLKIGYDIEKYWAGTSTFNINFFTSTDGVTWVAATAGDQAYSSDASNAVVNPPTTITKSFSLSGFSIATGTSFYLRWQFTSGATSNSKGFGIDNFSINCCSSNTYYYRSLTTGNWSNAASWEVSADGSTGWTTACQPPTNSAALITILNGHTITVDANSTASSITINSGGILKANSSSFVTLSINGNIINNGTLQLYDGITYGVNAVFNKNGNQSISGTGSTTNFYSIGLNMGTNYLNVLDISSTNFSCSAPYLLTNNVPAATLLNGTIKFSGTYTFSNSLFATTPTIPANAGIWLNNPNVTITGKNYSYNNNGYIRVTSGTYNFGNSTNNGVFLLTNSHFIVEGGTVNVAARIQAEDNIGNYQFPLNYVQSGGLVNLLTVASIQNGWAALDFEDPGDNFIMSGGTIVIRNQLAGTDYAIVNYSTSIITGGIIQFADALSTNINSYGFAVDSPSQLPSIVIDNSVGLNTFVYLFYDPLTILGNITINTGTTLNAANLDVSLTGNWNNNGTYSYQGTTTFKGISTPQYMTGSSTTFNNLTISNTSGGVTLQTPEYVAGTLTMSTGNLYTTATNLLTMNSGSAVTGASNSSFVSGPVAKTGSTAFVFPVGKDAEYRPIADSALSGSETFTAEYLHADPGISYDSSLTDPTINHISRCEYWTFNRTGSSVSADVILGWDTYSCGVDALPELTIAHWNGSMWKDQGNGGTTGSTIKGTIISNGTITSFSPFTLASTSQNNPLPIELLNFTAKYNGSNAVNLNWTTASETNNDYFTVERSADAVNYIEINKTKGSGNSTKTLYYSAKDASPLSGISYYRLKQTDYNGNYKYSNVSTVNITGSTNFQIINTYSTSPESGLEVTVNCSINCELTFELYDMTGRIIYTAQQNTTDNNNLIIIPTYLFSKGIYLLKAFNGDTIISKKVVVQ